MIKILDQNTIDKIAAGEVIERPYSVVKELTENSIDANATSITIEIKDGGTTYIRVTDNGDGIEKTDIRTAYMRHATSKITSADELNGVMTLGFRGEALSTIAAVSQTEMVTKTCNSLTGVKYIIHGGREVEFKEIGAPDGTTIVVKNIFFNTPARLKFLKSNMTEGSYINDLITRLSLSHPEISFKLISNGKTIIDTAGNGKAKEVIYGLYGRDITRNLLEINYLYENIKISGYIGKPFISKGNRSFENYFINNRYIKSNIINRAIEEAYKTFVMQHKFPFTVLYFELPGELCDVNVHPTKMEFRYHDEKTLFIAVKNAISEGLTNKELIPTSNTETTKNKIEVVKVPENKPSFTKHVENKQSITKQSTTNESTTKQNITKQNITKQNITKQNITKQSTTNQNTTKQSIIKPVTEKVNTAPKAKISSSYKILQELLPKNIRIELNESINYSKKEELPVKQDLNDVKEEKFEQQNLFEEKFLSKEAISHHRIIGQLFNTYWMTEYNDELYIMDQHAVHEKINYEHFLKNYKEKKVMSQNLYPPEIISVTASEKLIILENIDLFTKTGFEIEEFGGNEFKISAMPMNLYGLSGREIFYEFVASLSEGVSEITEDIFIRKIASMACKAAIKGGQKISEAEAANLIDELMTLDNPYTCPHGRPTIIKISKTELEKKFKRIV